MVNLHMSLEQLRVNSGHAVNSVRANNAQEGHIDSFLTIFLDQRHATHASVIVREALSYNL